MSENFQPFQSSAPQLGMLVQWNDEKGFGWIESGRKRFFMHIKDFDRGRWRPKIGEEVRFILGIDPKGRDCAKRVTFVKSSGDNEIVRSRVGVGSWVLLVLLLVLPLCALLWIPMPWWLCVGGMLVASAITYRMYGHDKQQAIAGGWRVPESWLHFAELAGGWPGAFVAQRRLRHKCSKPSYQSIFWTLILLYPIAAANVILDQRLSRALIEILNR